jgi:hypothetical protein
MLAGKSDTLRLHWLLLKTRSLKVDWIQLGLKDLPDLARRHLHDFRSCKEKLGTTYAGGLSIEALFKQYQPHFALQSQDTEKEYLREAVEILLTVLLPPEDSKSDVVRYLLREIFTCTVLLNAVDKICDPDFINELVLAVSSIGDMLLSLG